MEEEEEVEEGEEKEDEEEGTQRLVVSLSATTLNRPTVLPHTRDPPIQPLLPTPRQPAN